ncbi:C39 family peptidase [Natrinema sp. SYSU A 869]|uniref:C39 family peptidase n=1 Tax=Natrinema sp. SYSU A 869 TaxID=2871694 RepID=UPI001CA3C5B2|nr:C39 family peptidase [Natrinema sp. SYSU A 869]
MSGDTNKRRTVLKRIGVLSAALATPVMTGSALGIAEGNSTAVERSDRISEPIAHLIAKSRVEHNSTRKQFSDLDPEGLAKPELFYSVSETGTYRPAAWVYPIETDGEEVGHVAVSARPDSPGIIRCSTGVAPQTRLRHNRTLRSKVGRVKDGPRLIYNNPMSFGVEVPTTNVAGAEAAEDGKSAFVDLKHGLTASINAVANPESATQTDGTLTVDRTTLEEAEETSFSSLSTESISNVPNWNAHRCGSNWVGCTPAASSMCIGYHENISSRDCDLMWELNDHMGTNSNGETVPTDFVSGIEDYDSSYSASNTVWGRRSKIKNQIDSGNPCVLSHWFNSSLDKSDIDGVEDLKDIAVGHSETAYEYEEDDNPWYDPTEPALYVTTHDTYGSVNEISLKSTTVMFLVQSIEP